MKTNLLAIVAISLAVAACNKPEYAGYGAEVSPATVLASNEFSQKMADTDSANIIIETKVIETCSKKGCWMTVDLGSGEEMRVTFKDYGFFVPTEGVSGKNVIIEGTARKTTTDVETLRHFAEDAGKSQEEIAAITEPKEELTFVATGVLIEKGE